MHSRHLIKEMLRQHTQQRLRDWLGFDSAQAKTLPHPEQSGRPPHQQVADVAIQERLSRVLTDLLQAQLLPQAAAKSSEEDFSVPFRCEAPGQDAEITSRVDLQRGRPHAQALSAPGDKELLAKDEGEGAAIFATSDASIGALGSCAVSRATAREKTRPVIGAYAPLATEVDVVPLLRALSRAGYPLALPVCESGKRVMSWAAWDGDLKAVRGQTPLGFRPKEEAIDPTAVFRELDPMPDILLVPLVAFDQHLRRLGRGGGFYDATLFDLKARKKVVAVGLAYEIQALNILDFSSESAPQSQGLNTVADEDSSLSACIGPAPPRALEEMKWAEDHDMALDIIVTECNILDHGKEP